MRYKIANRREEFECPQCGEPLYVGETAWQDGVDGECFCSLTCCNRHGAQAHARAIQRVERAREESDITGL